MIYREDCFSKPLWLELLFLWRNFPQCLEQTSKLKGQTE
jgi:hypothetical protein